MKNEFTLAAELLNSMVLVIGNKYKTIGIGGDSPGGVEFTLTGAMMSPFGQVLAVTGKFLYPVIQCVNDVDVVVDINRDS